MLSGIVLSLLSVLCFAGYQISNRENILRYGLHKSTFYLYIISQLILTVGLIIGYIQNPALLHDLISANAWLFMVGLGFEGALTIILFFWLMDKTRLGLTYTLASTYSLMTVIAALVFLGEKINIISMIAIIAALTASMWLGFLSSVKNKNDENTYRSGFFVSVILPLTVAIGWTVFNFGCKVLVDRYGGFNTAFFTEGAVLLWIILWALLRYRRDISELSPKKEKMVNIGKTSLLFAIGGIAYYLALSLAPLSIVSGILGLAPAIVFVLSLIYLGERFSCMELISASVIIISIICISIFH